MKNKIFILLALCTFVACGSKEIDYKKPLEEHVEVFV